MKLVTIDEYFEPYMQYEIKRKEKQLYDLRQKYYSSDEVDGPKINFCEFQYNSVTDCYRELLVSFLQIIPMLKKQVRFDEADYIVYAHGYARCDDMSEFVCNQLREIALERKPGAEIIVVGKSANAEKLLNGEIENITFVGDHYAEYLGKRFGYPNIKEQYVVYDDYNNQLNIWPVDGCMNKCAFCRRCYMNIRFESQKYTDIKRWLDWYQENEPEKMQYVSLRAENLTEYGIDLYGKQMLHRIIALINSYEAVKEIEIKIGMCIGEMTDEIVDAICEAKKIVSIGMNLETGSNRLLKLIGKKHTCERAIEIFTKIRDANPTIEIESTIMIGLPTETITDMYLLADVIFNARPDFVLLNYYINSPNLPLNHYPQITDSLREYHLKILLKLLKGMPKDKYGRKNQSLLIKHRFIWGKRCKSRKWIREKIRLDKFNNDSNDFPSNMPGSYIRYNYK